MSTSIYVHINRFVVTFSNTCLVLFDGIRYKRDCHELMLLISAANVKFCLFIQHSGSPVFTQPAAPICAPSIGRDYLPLRCSLRAGVLVRLFRAVAVRYKRVWPDNYVRLSRANRADKICRRCYTRARFLMRWFTIRMAGRAGERSMTPVAAVAAAAAASSGGNALSPRNRCHISDMIKEKKKKNGNLITTYIIIRVVDPAVQLLSIIACTLSSNDCDSI